MLGIAVGDYDAVIEIIIATTPRLVFAESGEWVIATV